jgi:hypothetical protein
MNQRFIERPVSYPPALFVGVASFKVVPYFVGVPPLGYASDEDSGLRLGPEEPEPLSRRKDDEQDKHPSVFQ